jgi:D-alanyl-D-alanine dipeptidase
MKLTRREWLAVYDEMTERAYPQYSGGDPEHRRTRDLLRHQMERQGFTVFPVEWWHFDYKDWPLYPVLDQAPPHRA